MVDQPPPTPRRLRNNKVWKGMPIPANTMILPDGTPDFAATNSQLSNYLAANKRCALCGQRIRGEVAFIASLVALAAPVPAFRDGPMHRECAEYSFVICPFVSGEHRQYRTNEAIDAKYQKIEGLDLLKDHAQEQPTLANMGMLLCPSWRVEYAKTIGGAGVAYPAYLADEPFTFVDMGQGLPPGRYAPAE